MSMSSDRTIRGDGSTGVTRGSSYSFRTHGRASGRESRGPAKYLLLPEVTGVQIVRPKWKHGDSPVTIRPLPAPDPERPGRVLPGRYSTAAGDFTDWLRSYPGVAYAAAPNGDHDPDCTPLTCILYDRSLVGNDYQHDLNPYVLLQAQLYLGKKDNTWPNASWYYLLENGRMKREEELLFMRALCYRDGDKQNVRRGMPPMGADPDSGIPLFYCGTMPMRALIKLLDEQTEDYTGDPMKFSKSMKYGDPTSLKAGRFFTFISPKANEGAAAANDDDDTAGVSWNTKPTQRVDAKASTGGGGGGMSYQPIITKGLPDATGKESARYSPEIPEEQRAGIMARIQPFNRLLRVPEHEELCAWIARAFPHHGDAVKWAWRDHPEYYTKEVRKIFVKAKSLAVPADVERGDDMNAELEEWADSALSGSASRKNKTIRGTADMAKKQGRAVVDEDLDDDDLLDAADVEEEDDEDAAPPKKKSGKKPGKKAPPVEEDDDDDYDEDDDGVEDDDAEDDDEDDYEDDDGEDDDDDAEDDDGEDEDDDDAEVDEDDDYEEGGEEEPAPRKPVKKPGKKPPVEEDDEEDEEEEEDDEEEEPAPKKPSKKPGKKPVKKPGKKAPPVEEDDEEDEEEEAPAPKKPGKKLGQTPVKKPGKKAPPVEEDDDDEDEEEAPAPKKPSKKLGKKGPPAHEAAKLPKANPAVAAANARSAQRKPAPAKKRKPGKK